MRPHHRLALDVLVQSPSIGFTFVKCRAGAIVPDPEGKMANLSIEVL